MKTKPVLKFVCAALAVFARRTLVAAATFSTPFGDGMVLQRGRPVPVWGTAAPGEAVGSGWYVPWVDGLGYYDAVNFAKRIPVSCRTVIPRAGLGDYVCPPMGLAKLWNAIPGDNKKIVWVQGSQHLDVPPEYEGRDFPKTK